VTDLTTDSKISSILPPAFSASLIMFTDLAMVLLFTSLAKVSKEFFIGIPKAI
jgi:hypothetical protein